MSLSIKDFRLTVVLAMVVALANSGHVCAGWMGFRNDTNGTIVIQEAVNTGGQTRLGKPQRLFSGEAVRDTPAAGCQRRISVFDPTNPNQPIYSGIFACPAANENILYCIKSDGKGGIVIEALKSPAPATPSKK